MIFTMEQIALYILVSINILFVLWLTRLEIKSKDIKIMKDKQGLRNKLNSIEEKIETLYQFGNKTVDELHVLEDKLKDNIQNVEVVRFNPFKNDGIGGDQSFAVTLLNKNGNGVIISSLYARDKVSVFAKPVQNWQSKYELSEEEKNVLDKTKSSV